jgi:hypothetical protein
LPPSLLERCYAQGRHEQAPLVGDGRSANQANQIWVLTMMMMLMMMMMMMMTMMMMLMMMTMMITMMMMG